MRIAVFGAAGATGRLLTQLALDEGHQVTAVVRDAAPAWASHPRLRLARCDVRDDRAVHAALEGHEVVLCALGARRGHEHVYSEGARHIVAGMKARGVRRIVFLSNFGVLGERAVGLRSLLLLGLARAVLRDTLAHHRRALAELQASGLEWVAVRAMVLTNGEATGRYRVRTTDLPAHGTHISRRDLARFMLDAALSDRHLNQSPAIAY